MCAGTAHESSFLYQEIVLTIVYSVKKYFVCHPMTIISDSFYKGDEVQGFGWLRQENNILLIPY